MIHVQLEQIDHVALRVRDIQRAAAWYQQVLGLQRRHQEAWGDLPIMLGAGQTCIALFAAGHTPAPPDLTSVNMSHLAFRTDGPGLAQARADLEHYGVTYRWEDHQISHSIYFQDPDGHRLEITTYDLPEDGRRPAAPA